MNLFNLAGDVPDEPECDNVVGNEFGVVLAWFFETEKKDDELLAPVSSMHEVVSLQVGHHIPVRITYGWGCQKIGYTERREMTSPKVLCLEPVRWQSRHDILCRRVMR